MSEQEALIAAIRAEESAKSAHHRLDKMNGSIERLGREVGDLRSDLREAIAASRAEAKASSDAILLRLAHGDGIEEGATSVKASFLDSRRWVIGLAASFVGSGTFVVIATYLLRG